MAAKSPVKEPPANPTTPPLVKSSISSSSSESDVVSVPSYSRWFSWDTINECELRFLPEFFDSRSPSKNPRVYMYYRNSIIKQYRENSSRKITFTDVRRTLVGDVGSIRRVFDFLETWGLINYSVSSVKPLKWEDKETKSAAASESSPQNKEASKRLCSGCKSLCSIACFACDKYDLTLCARCYVRGNYQVGVNSSDFRRVEISEESKTDWTEKETLQLLEAVMHYGDNWKKVAQLVSGRSEKDCISYFIKLPFGEEFIDPAYPGDADDACNIIKHSSDTEGVDATSPRKKMRLTPLADASNPIMAQAAFLSALVGVEIAEAAARAAVKSISELDDGASRQHLRSLDRNTRQQEAEAASGVGASLDVSERSINATALIKKEEQDIEKAIRMIAEVKMKEIQDKIVRFEGIDLQMEKERKRLEQMKNMLFADQLSLLFHKKFAAKTKEHMQNAKTEN